MARYINKQVLIEAYKWHENEPWVDGMETCGCGENDSCHLCGEPIVKTRQGFQRVFDGWYVFKTADGNYNACSPERFNEMYAPV